MFLTLSFTSDFRMRLYFLRHPFSNAGLVYWLSKLSDHAFPETHWFATDGTRNASETLCHHCPFLANELRRALLSFAATPALRSATSLILNCAEVPNTCAISEGVRS